MLYYENSNIVSQGNNNSDSFEILIWAGIPNRKPIILSYKNPLSFVMCCAIWYNLHNLITVKKTQSNTKLTKSNTPPWVYFWFFKL